MNGGARLQVGCARVRLNVHAVGGVPNLRGLPFLLILPVRKSVVIFGDDGLHAAPFQISERFDDFASFRRFGDEVSGKVYCARTKVRLRMARHLRHIKTHAPSGTHITVTFARRHGVGMVHRR